MDQALAFAASIKAAVGAFVHAPPVQIDGAAVTKYALVSMAVVLVTSGAAMAYMLARWRRK